MNFFEAQLKWMLGNRSEFENAKYVGRACYVPLSNGTNIRAEFVTQGTYQKYEALKLSAINKADGQIDSVLYWHGTKTKKLCLRLSISVSQS